MPCHGVQVIHQIGVYRSISHVTHYGTADAPESIYCSGWKGGGNARWTDEWREVTCEGCVKVRVGLPPSARTLRWGFK